MRKASHSQLTEEQTIKELDKDMIEEKILKEPNSSAYALDLHHRGIVMMGGFNAVSRIGLTYFFRTTSIHNEKLSFIFDTHALPPC